LHNSQHPTAAAEAPVRAGIFPTFFLSGFECSTFVWKNQGRRNLTAETQHLQHADEDYAVLRSLGIAVAREGIPWPLVDKEGGYDFSGLDPVIAAMNRYQILPGICATMATRMSSIPSILGLPSGFVLTLERLPST